MTNKQFALAIAVVAIICAAYAYFIIPGNFPTGSGGALLLRDDLLRMSER